MTRKLDYFDVWFPNVAPSAELLCWAHEDQETRWGRFVERYMRELSKYSLPVLS